MGLEGFSVNPQEDPGEKIANQAEQIANEAEKSMIDKDQQRKKLEAELEEAEKNTKYEGLTAEGNNWADKADIIRKQLEEMG